jgi:hypothetical protein
MHKKAPSRPQKNKLKENCDKVEYDKIGPKQGREALTT